MHFLEVSGVSVGEVLKGISFSQAEHERLAIVGESGSGKSTLLKVISGFAQADSGRVHFEGKRVLGPDEQLIAGHPGIAYLSQHFELRHNYWVEEILSYANALPEEEAAQIFDICKITPFLRRRTNEVSGGERQRIALARLLVGRPRLLVLDEPFSNLDLIHTELLRSVISEVESRLETTCLMVSHDPRDILSWADRILVMRAGQLIQEDTPELIYKQPVDRYVASLFGKCNEVSAATLRLLGGGNAGATFVRPEDLRLSSMEVGNADMSVSASAAAASPVAASPAATTAAPGIPGSVVAISFQGSHYDIEVDTEDGRLIVLSAHNGLEIGEQIRVSLRQR